MKKAMITGIVIFVGFFLATLVWFVHDKDEYKKLKYDRAYSNVKMNNLNIDTIIQNSQLSKENIVVLNIMVIMMLRYIAQKIIYKEHKSDKRVIALILILLIKVNQN